MVKKLQLVQPNGTPIKKEYPNMDLILSEQGLEVRVWHTGYFYQNILVPEKELTGIANNWIAYLEDRDKINV